MTTDAQSTDDHGLAVRYPGGGDGSADDESGPGAPRRPRPRRGGWTRGGVAALSAAAVVLGAGGLADQAPGPGLTGPAPASAAAPRSSSTAGNGAPAALVRVLPALPAAQAGLVSPAVGPAPTKTVTIATLSKTQATAVAAALMAGDTAAVSGLIPEPYATTLNLGGQGLAPLFSACGTDGLPGACWVFIENNPLKPGFGAIQVVSIGAI